MKKPFFAFKATSGGPPTLSIFEEIGAAGVDAGHFSSQLSAVKSASINLEINSPGGDVFAGLAIYNMLKQSGKTINAKVMGVAASAASVVLMAGHTIEMPRNTFVMIHNPWTATVGNAEKLRETAGVLDKIGESLLAIYTARTRLSESELRALLAKDTWLTAEEAHSKGFATSVTDEIEALARFDLGRAALPSRISAIFQANSAPHRQASTAAIWARRRQQQQGVNQ